MPANRLTKIRTELGTPDFISPEQVRDAHSVDIRADIYSLGATLYFLLVGQPPFHGRSDEQKQLAQAREEFPPLENLRPEVPPNVLNVLKKMVKKERDQRYATPGEVAAALQSFACTEPHRTLALLAPVSHANSAPVDTGRILDEKTQMAPPPSGPILSPPPSNRMVLWLAGAASLLVVLSACILLAVIGVGMMWNKEKDPKGDGQIAKDKGEENTKEGGNKKEGPLNRLKPPPPQGPVLAEGPAGLLKSMSGASLMIPILFTPDGLRGVARAKWARRRIRLGPCRLCAKTRGSLGYPYRRQLWEFNRFPGRQTAGGG